VLGVPAISGGAPAMLISGDVGPDYIVQGSTNLGTTNRMTLVLSNSSAPPFLFADPVPINPPQRYYRVLLGP